MEVTVQNLHFAKHCPLSSRYFVQWLNSSFYTFLNAKFHFFYVEFYLLLSVTCIQGGYPSHLISEWDKWDTKHTSENDKPGKRYSINCIDEIRRSSQLRTLLKLVLVSVVFLAASIF